MRFFTIAIVIMVSVVVQGQENCPVLERASIAEAGVWCADTPDGYACYGNALVSIDSVEPFGNSGDLIPLERMTTITSAVDREGNAWGVARLQALAHRADSWQTQRVTLILLGDVGVTNQGEDGLSIRTLTTPIVANGGANLRRAPSNDAPILDVVGVNERVKVTGRSEDGQWLRVQRLEGGSAWLTVGAVSLSNLDDVPMVTTEDDTPALLYRPFSDMVVRGGADGACEGASASGLLVQTQDASAGAMLRINGREMMLGGTLFIQANEQGETVITQVHVLEGAITSDGERIEGGRTLRYDDEGSATQSYDSGRFADIPTHLLGRWVYIAVDVSQFIAPRPSPDRSPLVEMSVDAPCRITTGETGSNLRAGPGTAYPIQGVMAYRESAQPTGRFIAPDGSQWWRIAPYLWVRRDTTVTGGDCISVPEVSEVPAPPPAEGGTG